MKLSYDIDTTKATYIPKCENEIIAILKQNECTLFDTIVLFQDILTRIENENKITIG